MDANGTNVQTLTDDGSGPVWSADGNRIAFVSTIDESSEIYVMNADGSARTRITDNLALDAGPTWSPDGSRIVFTHGSEVGSDILVMNADGTSPANITNTPFSAEVTAAWSPDGGRIAFVSDRDGNGEIYVMNADGSNPTNISMNAAAESLPGLAADSTGTRGS